MWRVCWVGLTAGTFFLADFFCGAINKKEWISTGYWIVQCDPVSQLKKNVMSVDSFELTKPSKTLKPSKKKKCLM
jgi:hypothetical protein